MWFRRAASGLRSTAPQISLFAQSHVKVDNHGLPYPRGGPALWQQREEPACPLLAGRSQKPGERVGQFTHHVGQCSPPTPRGRGKGGCGVANGGPATRKQEECPPTLRRAVSAESRRGPRRWWTRFEPRPCHSEAVRTAARQCGCPSPGLAVKQGQ